MAKNIEMNYKDESGYEILRPQTTCEMVIDLLNEDTKELMGLSSSDQADDAFRKVYLAQVLDGRALINFTVMGDDGTPCTGVQIESAQFCDSTGNKETVIETNDEGKASIFVDNTSVQASISKYANLSDWSETIAVEFGQQYDKEITLTRYNFKLWESSGSCKFSSEIVRVDASLCGGGGSGRNGLASSVGRGMSGGGGGGGFGNAQESFSFLPNQIYQYTVGAGGKSESAGGRSSFGSLSVNGGQAGQQSAGGTGNGNGGYIADDGYSGRDGEEGTGYIYTTLTEEILIGGGGGGGANAFATPTWASGSRNGGKGGTPNGGKGANARATSNGSVSVTVGEAASNYGGGGGGGGVASAPDGNYRYSNGGQGGPGVVSIRMYRQQDLPT